MQKIAFFDTESPANPYIIIYLNRTPRPDVAQCWPLLSCKKSKQIYNSVSNKMSKNLNFYTYPQIAVSKKLVPRFLKVG